MMPFDRAEYVQRIDKTKECMVADGIDVLLISDPSNMNYLTGYNGWSFYVHQLVALALDDGEPMWIGRRMDVACAKFTVFMQPDRIVGYPEDYVQTSDRHEMDFIAGVLRERGWGKDRLGVEMDSYYFTPRALERLREGLPEATFADANCW